jgi:hypothetical protein
VVLAALVGPADLEFAVGGARSTTRNSGEPGIDISSFARRSALLRERLVGVDAASGLQVISQNAWSKPASANSSASGLAVRLPAVEGVLEGRDDALEVVQRLAVAGDAHGQAVGLAVERGERWRQITTERLADALGVGG